MLCVYIYIYIYIYMYIQTLTPLAQRLAEKYGAGGVNLAPSCDII